MSEIFRKTEEDYFRRISAADYLVTLAEGKELSRFLKGTEGEHYLV